MSHTYNSHRALQHTTAHCNTLNYTATHDTNVCDVSMCVTWCSIIQTHVNTLQHSATHCNTLQHTATHCNTMQRTATHYGVPHHPDVTHIHMCGDPHIRMCGDSHIQLTSHTFVCMGTWDSHPKHKHVPHCALQHTIAHCNTLQHTATHFNALQHTTPHYNTLQHTATHDSFKNIITWARNHTKMNKTRGDAQQT